MLAGRLREKRKQVGLTLEEFSKRMGVSLNTVYRWESGKHEPDDDTKRRICTILGITLGYLMGDDTTESTEGSKAIPVPNQILVPILHPSYIACAGGGHNLHGVIIEAAEHIPLPLDELGPQGEEPIFGVRVEGTSMEAADIKDGSLAVINPNMEIRYGDPCLVCFGIDEAAIKYVYPLPDGGLRIESADPSYKKHHFSKEEVEGGLVRVVGTVVTTIWMGKPKRGI
jgi:transcriptional regulator with XRE-family HTH domain